MAGVTCLFAIPFLLLSATVAEAAPQGNIGSDPGAGERPLCASVLQRNTLSQTAYIGIWADANHVDCDVFPAIYTQFDAYVWCLPSSRGLIAAEFAVSFPAWVITLATAQHPNIAISLGSLMTGISVAFGEGNCQRNWVWLHRVTCMSLANTSGLISIIPHPAVQPVPAYQFASCEPGYPIESCTILSSLYVNQSCSWCIPSVPVLTNVTVESSTVIHAFFDVPPMPPLPPPTSNHFLLYDEVNPTDTIRCILAEVPQYGSGYEFVLTLESAMADNTTYILQALKFHQNAGYAGDSQYEFTFHEANATLLQSCSAAMNESGIELAWELSEVGDGVEFFVSRSEGGADFVPLDMTRLARSGLVFTYVDSRVEPGKRYAYKVEYSHDGARWPLFISEEIRTPAALLALHQNRPNPFNPSTTISFTLPAECAVRLDVYDVSGRLVARLIDGARQSAGSHEVEWNGRDASGRAAASGIYVCRLTAGRETISRKMVLLR
jgi:hypothetical protein